ncbi:MAG: Nre family DNA repair protein [Candidatus Hydrothermarchaeales archaeon]
MDLFSDSRGASRCVLCRGAKMLCGKARCPVLVRYYHQNSTRPLLDSLHLDGSSPPSVFVGRIGYPKVYVGPLVPPIHGDTSLMDTPELWSAESIDDIVSFRSQLVRGKYRVDVENVEKGGRIVDLTRELALCASPAEADMEFSKKPAGRLTLDDEVQPFGPSAPIENLNLGTMRIDARIDKAYDDTDLNAVDAVMELYEDDVLVSKIQRGFSVGAFGLKKGRRFVPTRWSITAVDDIISKNLVEEVRSCPTIDEFRVYESWRLDNRFIVLMIPSGWSYELIEAWYPNTVWNPRGRRIVMYSSVEGHGGKSTYAEIGGCYYAARLAVSEYLNRQKKQASVVILREAHPGYIMPVGVWNVRENVRNALKNEPRKFDTMGKALEYVTTRLDIPMERWMLNSRVLKDALYQRRLEDF